MNCNCQRSTAFVVMMQSNLIIFSGTRFTMAHPSQLVYRIMVTYWLALSRISLHGMRISKATT
jgi:hypothetical protein